MNLLRMTSTPFLIGLLLSAFGWHVSQLSDDIRSTRSVVYQIEDGGDGEAISAIVTNVSKAKMVEHASFAFVSDEMNPCLRPESGGVKMVPPTATYGMLPRGDKSIYGFDLDLAPGGSIGLSVGRIAGRPAPKLLFFPQGLPIADETAPPTNDKTDVGKSDKPQQDLYVLDASTWRGYAVLNYFELVWWSFVALSVILLLALALLGLDRKSSASGDQDGSQSKVPEGGIGGGSGFSPIRRKYVRFRGIRQKG